MKLVLKIIFLSLFMSSPAFGADSVLSLSDWKMKQVRSARKEVVFTQRRLKKLNRQKVQKQDLESEIEIIRLNGVLGDSKLRLEMARDLSFEAYLQAYLVGRRPSKDQLRELAGKLSQDQVVDLLGFFQKQSNQKNSNSRTSSAI